MECGLWMSDSCQTVGLLYKGKAFPIIYWTLLFCVVPSYLPTCSCQEVALSSCFFLEIHAQEILLGQRSMAETSGKDQEGKHDGTILNRWLQPQWG